ncbi:DUF262 domain-containing protein (plasmid) [Lichenicola cladoniae]|uniref:DUF262 domain-containing protein n=1 Tax=Lichenicola cladoniae TaxID=1484109 RepID=A0A6M8HXS3_9PROT|nr:DUF262 domain-containing protein [Lichenicola cladoniae]NPD66274.1 DUF262 domain-containing protein [Acetobacteraceae bacterium]QKE93192.1 DUF262 domain-containing protein [Lichenicola cladoniae]
MKPYTRSIIELFDGKKRFLIPLYQRQYAWKVKPQLNLLWEDVERAISRLTTDRASLSPHFMGAIVIAQIKTFGKQVQAFEIIDGQQRLTTFQLLLSALRDVAISVGSKYADETQKYLLNDGVMENPLTERFKLWPSLTDRRSFVEIIDRNTDLDAIALRPVDEDGLVRQSVAAHAYFKDVITKHVMHGGEFDEYRLEILFEALKDGLAVVSIELEGGDDPQTIFETLNSRGVDLTPGDLMRNFIFQRAKGLGQTDDGSLIVDKLYEKHWLPLDRLFWNHIEPRGRQSRRRLDWMLTDHLAMQIGNLVSVETLFEDYRRWILDTKPYTTIEAELESITATALVEKRLFDKQRGDPLGDFGRFADDFDVSTAMPLVIYLATEAQVGAKLKLALAVLESFILRRDICALDIKNYNKLFVGLIARLRAAEGCKVDALIADLSSRVLEIDRWPDNHEWRQGWIGRDQYKPRRQPRLRYLFEAIEQQKRTALNENIEIKSALTIEHIMPQGWTDYWPIPGFDHLEDDDLDPEHVARQTERHGTINKLGNLTLLTQNLNATVSNGPFSVKMPAVRAHSSLALNRELNAYDHWDEETIAERAAGLFQVACAIWVAPSRDKPLVISTDLGDVAALQRASLPPHGTVCHFTYGGTKYTGRIDGETLLVNNIPGAFSSFSAASKAISQTSRNGWNDWHLEDGQGHLVLADDWRKQQTK